MGVTTMIYENINAIKVPVTVDGVVYVLITSDDGLSEFYLINSNCGDPVYMFGIQTASNRELQEIAERNAESYLPEEWNVLRRTVYRVEEQTPGDWFDLCRTYDIDNARKAARDNYDSLSTEDRRGREWWIHSYDVLMCDDILAEDALRYLSLNSCDGPEPANSEEWEP